MQGAIRCDIYLRVVMWLWSSGYHQVKVKVSHPVVTDEVNVRLNASSQHKEGLGSKLVQVSCVCVEHLEFLDTIFIMENSKQVKVWVKVFKTTPQQRGGVDKYLVCVYFSLLGANNFWHIRKAEPLLGVKIRGLK